MWTVALLFVKANWKAILMVALLLLAIGLIHHAGAHSQKLKDDKQINSLVFEVKQYKEAQATNLETIRVLKKDNKAFADAAASAPTQAQVQELTNERDALQSALQATRNKRRTIYAHDPKADAWGRAPVPSGIADQLRQ